MSWNPLTNWLTRRLERSVEIAKHEMEAASDMLEAAKGEDAISMCEFMLNKAEFNLISRTSILKAHLKRTAG